MPKNRVSEKPCICNPLSFNLSSCCGRIPWKKDVGRSGETGREKPKHLLYFRSVCVQICARGPAEVTLPMGRMCLGQISVSVREGRSMISG